MEDEKLNQVKDNVRNNLEKQIANLESVKAELEEDLKTCPPAERDRNQKLLHAAVKLLEEMKVAQTNINLLINRKIE